jgi:hypothetical protein
MYENVPLRERLMLMRQLHMQLESSRDCSGLEMQTEHLSLHLKNVKYRRLLQSLKKVEKEEKAQMSHRKILILMKEAPHSNLRKCTTYRR